MANPQKENGYTAIANEIMDALIKIRIPGEARQVLDCVLRQTYGWNKKTDAIALSQFVLFTGLSKVHICQSLVKLKSMNLITEKGKAITEKGNEIGQVYEFNKDFDTWQPLPKKVTLPKKVKSITEKGKNPLPKKGTTKDNIKDIKDKYRDFVFLTSQEYERLLTDYGKQNLDLMIETLDNYIGAMPKKRNKYTDHNRVLRGWVLEKLEIKKINNDPLLDNRYCKICKKKKSLMSSTPNVCLDCIDKRIDGNDNISTGKVN